MFHHKVPIICRVPGFTIVECPTCGSKFNYLVGDIDTDRPHPINKCPQCGWIFDDVFYCGIQPKYKIIEYANLKIPKQFESEFKKRNKKKRWVEVLDDVELLDRYKKNGLIWIHQASFEDVKDGRVWEFPSYKPLTRMQKISNKFTEIITDILPFTGKYLKYIQPQQKKDQK